MENSLVRKNRNRIRRALRTRKTLRGTPERPRLCVVKSNSHLHVQLIDDENHETVASTSTISKDFRTTNFNRRNKESAKALGSKIAELALAKDIKKIVFDRGSHKYHGVVASLADAAREAGLEF